MRKDFPDSTNIDYAEYDPATDTLIVKFKSGGIYSYDNVPESIYHGIRSSDSAGGYFYRNVRGKYSYKRIK